MPEMTINRLSHCITKQLQACAMADWLAAILGASSAADSIVSGISGGGFNLGLCM